MSDQALRIVIVGAGGHGREIFAVLAACNHPHPRYAVLGFLDDGQPDNERLRRLGTRWLGGCDALKEIDACYVLGVGSSSARHRVYERLSAIRGIPAPSIIHPTSWIGPDVELGLGTVVCAGVSITTNVRIGQHVHLNRGTTVGHDAVLGDFVTVAPLSAISGNVIVEDEAELGTGVCVIPGVKIGRAAVIGAAALVTRDIPSGVTAFGVPARPR
jgi:sugar O-acyltransferase (sialic acid O-acetyltransferase NeuD family)